MSREVRVGEHRAFTELLNLGINVGETSVNNYRVHYLSGDYGGRINREYALKRHQSMRLVSARAIQICDGKLHRKQLRIALHGQNRMR
jgi:hypothetical protein